MSVPRCAYIGPKGSFVYEWPLCSADESRMSWCLEPQRGPRPLTDAQNPVGRVGTFVHEMGHGRAEEEIQAVRARLMSAAFNNDCMEALLHAVFRGQSICIR